VGLPARLVSFGNKNSIVLGRQVDPDGGACACAVYVPIDFNGDGHVDRSFSTAGGSEFGLPLLQSHLGGSDDPLGHYDWPIVPSTQPSEVLIGVHHDVAGVLALRHCPVRAIRRGVYALADFPDFKHECHRQ
jgi:hypothetical protein